jgi:predicted transcriptional regulator
MKRHRIATTISYRHWELLKKHEGKLETQQKALEQALECLENNSKQFSELTAEQKYWLGFESINSMCCIQKDALKILMETANLERFKEYMTQNKPIECVVEYFYQKSLKDCSLKEVVEGLAIVFRISHLFDTINYKDNGDY